MKVVQPKSSTHYVREFRERMRGAGLVKKDVWIQPDFSEELAAVEKRLRRPPGQEAEHEGSAEREGAASWTLPSLQRALASTPLVQSGNIGVHRLEGNDPSLHLVMREFGDLPLFVAVGGMQIIVQAVMWPVDHVINPAAFNAHVLRTHQLMPLTTVGIEPVCGVPCYIMFGSLDTRSSLANVLFEIETLAENVIASVDVYRSFLSDDAQMPMDVA